MAKAVVTIGIPVFNNAQTLLRAINSVKSQSIQNWKLVLSDDRSDDDSWRICKHAAESDDRIVAIRQPKRRVFMNFGELLVDADTSYFVWLSADDYWASDFLERSINILDSNPQAVSALPRCEFIDEKGDIKSPHTETLDLPGAVRIRQFLAYPGGTRMYGVMRTSILRTAFPHRNMNAYDWYLMIGLLRAGSQIEVPKTLLYRELTDWMHYAEIVDQIYDSRVFRRFPILDMSLQLVWHRKIPIANLVDLLKLNFRKHEEYLLITRPLEFARRSWLFRILGLPLSNKPKSLVGFATALIRKNDARIEGACRILHMEMDRGEKLAALALGNMRREGIIGGDALECYVNAARLGSADGYYYIARLQFEQLEIGKEEMWEKILAAAHRGSDAALKSIKVSISAGEIPENVEKIVRQLIRVGQESDGQ